MGYLVATIVLFGFVPLSLLLFTRLRPPIAAAVVVLGGIMFLPEIIEFDVPGLPPFDKGNAISLGALIGALYACRPRLIAAKPGLGYDVLTWILVLGSFFTVATNTDHLIYGPRVERGLGRGDAISMAIQGAINWGIPFFLGRAFFRNMRDIRALAMAIVIAGLIYSLAVLIEARLSPHLHKWTYGYHPAPFRNMIRGSGWKPMGYMGSGLAMGLFMCTSWIVTSSLASTRVKLRRIPLTWFLPYFAVIQLLCRSMSSILYGFTLTPLVYWIPTRQLRFVVFALAMVIFTYPLTRAIDVFPDDAMVAVAEAVSEDRARSLWFRFTQEGSLLEKAQERMLFGWGIGGRNRVYDPIDGKDRSVTDGFWIIQLGSRGLVGWFASFAILLFPTFHVCTRLAWIPDGKDRRVLLGLCMLVLTYTVDLLPNALWSSLPIFVSGALAGVISNVRPPRRKRRDDDEFNRAVESPPTTASQLLRSS